jgi:hypothetical protein
VLGGPESLSEHIEELGEVPERSDKVTTKRKDRPLSEAALIRRVGTAREGGDVQEWASGQPKSTIVHQNEDIPPDIKALFPKTSGAAKSGPDAVSIDVAKKEITVFDATSKPTPEHTDKTHSDAETIKQNLPERFKDFKVFSQEGWSDGGLTFSPRKQH